MSAAPAEATYFLTVKRVCDSAPGARMCSAIHPLSSAAEEAETGVDFGAGKLWPAKIYQVRQMRGGCGRGRQAVSIPPGRHRGEGLIASPEGPARYSSR